MDVPGQEKRTRPSVPVCPISGPGALTKSERQRRASEIIQESGADTPECLERSNASLGVTFREQAEWWLEHSQTRNRRPIKPATVANWRSHIGCWLNPNIGDLPLGSFGNAAMKELVSKLVKAGLKASSIHTITTVAKLVKASAVDQNGEQLYPQVWNSEFIDMPQVENQHRPTYLSEELEAIIPQFSGDALMFGQLIAGTTLRIGELTGLGLENIVDNCTVIQVRKSVWNFREQSPKSKAAVRDIDLHPDLARVLRGYIAGLGRQTGLLFATRTGRPKSKSHIMKRWINPVLDKLGLERRGYHAFRRFRYTWLGQNGCPDALKRYWMGHADREIGHLYDQARTNKKYRKEWAERVGLGFTVRETEIHQKPPVLVEVTSAAEAA
jgi:integrase